MAGCERGGLSTQNLCQAVPVPCDDNNNTGTSGISHQTALADNNNGVLKARHSLEMRNIRHAAKNLTMSAMFFHTHRIVSWKTKAVMTKWDLAGVEVQVSFGTTELAFFNPKCPALTRSSFPW